MSSALPASALVSERGRRPANEDRVLATTLPDGRALLLVADGMGGHAGGAVASETAARTMELELARGAGFAAAVQSANAAILQRARDEPALQGMGTTLVALLERPGSYEIANVGDSRAYRVFADRVEQITDDHSFLAEAVRSGQMTHEAASRSPWRNVLTRSLGSDAALRVDRFGPYRVDGLAPHAVVLCSDGLYRVTSADEIRGAITGVGSADAAAWLLVSRALAAGSDDNVSVVVRDYGLFRASRPGAGTPLPAPPHARRVAERAEPDRLLMPASQSTAPAWMAHVARVSDHMLFAACAAMLLIWITLLLLDL